MFMAGPVMNAFGQPPGTPAKHYEPQMRQSQMPRAAFIPPPYPMAHPFIADPAGGRYPGWPVGDADIPAEDAADIYAAPAETQEPRRKRRHRAREAIASSLPSILQPAKMPYRKRRPEMTQEATAIP
jgi:hypothetical protein